MRHHRTALKGGPGVPPPATVFVVLSWGERVFYANAVERGRLLTLGEGPGEIFVPSEQLGAPRLPLVSFGRAGPRVHLPRRATGSLTLGDGTAQSIEALRPAGTHRRMAPEWTLVSLPIGASVALALDSLTIMISHTTVGAGRRFPRSAALDRRLASCVAAAAIPIVGLLVLAANAMPRLAETTPNDPGPAEGGGAYVVKVSWDGAAELETELGLAREHASADTPHSSEEVVPCRCRPTGQTRGRPTAAASGRYGVAGPADNPDPHIARPPDGDAQSWVFASFYGVPIAAGADPDAPTAPWGRDDALGTDPLSARGALWGEHLAGANGDDALGLEWPTGGLVKAIESTEADEGGPSSPPRVIHTGLRVDGPITPSAVLPVLATRLPAVRACYASALVRTPDLRGRIALRFETSRGDGPPAPPRLTPSELGATDFSHCLERAFRGLVLPCPESRTCGVTYPITLVPGGRGGLD